MAQKNLNGYTFDHAPVSASADGNLYNELSLEDRVIKGYADELPVTAYNLKMTIGAGQFLSRGRLVEVKGPIDIDVPPFYSGYLIAHLDLSQINDYTGDPSTTEYRFVLNQADIRLTKAPLTDSPDIHETIIGTVSSTSTNVTFTKDWRFFNPDLLRRNTEIIGSSTPNFGYANNYRLGSTSTAVDDHSDTLLLPIMANSNNQLNVDDTPAYNFDAISDTGGFTGTLPVPSDIVPYSRLEYRWTQTRSVNRIFEKLHVTTGGGNNYEGVYIRWHAGTAWSVWQKVATTSNLADLSGYTSGKWINVPENQYMTGNIQIAIQSGVVTIGWGGNFKSTMGAGDTVVANTAQLGIPLPMMIIRGAVSNVSSETPHGGSFRWLTNGDITINLSSAITSTSSSYYEFGGSGPSKTQFQPLANAQYNSSL